MKIILDNQNENCKQNCKKPADSELALKISDSDCKPVFVNFNGGNLTSNAGVLLLKEVDQQIRLIERIANVIPDYRNQSYIDHTYPEMLRQRVAQISCGYEDTNDCNPLRTDPILKIFSGKNPESDNALSSQPTMSRFENAISRTTLYRIAKVFVDCFVESYEKEPKVIVLDFDDTEDKVHGAQQLALFNGYFKDWCYMPLHVYEGLSGKLITTMLKGGKRTTAKQILSLLKRLVARFRQVWPNTYIIFRGDSHFAAPKIMAWIDEQYKVMFVTGLTGYEPLQKKVAPLVERAKKLYESKQNKSTLFHSFYYKAGTWSRYYRVVAKVEVSEKGHELTFYRHRYEGRKS